jgi:hypothetical protein
MTRHIGRLVVGVFGPPSSGTCTSFSTMRFGPGQFSSAGVWMSFSEGSVYSTSTFGVGCAPSRNIAIRAESLRVVVINSAAMRARALRSCAMSLAVTGIAQALRVVFLGGAAVGTSTLIGHREFTPSGVTLRADRESAPQHSCALIISGAGGT